MENAFKKIKISSVAEYSTCTIVPCKSLHKNDSQDTRQELTDGEGGRGNKWFYCQEKNM